MAATSTQAAGLGWWRSGLGKFGPYLYLLPAALIIIVFRFIPILYSVRISLYRWGIAGAGAFLGIGNYAEMIRDGIFWRSMLNASYYVIGVVPLGIVISLSAALLRRPSSRRRSRTIRTSSSRVRTTTAPPPSTRARAESRQLSV